MCKLRMATFRPDLNATRLFCTPCLLQIAIDNPPARGEQMRVFNQFTEQFR